MTTVQLSNEDSSRAEHAHNQQHLLFYHSVRSSLMDPSQPEIRDKVQPPPSSRRETQRRLSRHTKQPIHQITPDQATNGRGT